jgi:two-component system response regulator RegX3
VSEPLGVWICPHCRTTMVELSGPRARMHEQLYDGVESGLGHGASMHESDITYDARTMAVTYRGVGVQLTPTERALLVLLLRDPERVITRGEIGATLWGRAYVPGTRAIDVHIYRLRAKFHQPPHPNVSLFISHPGVGYSLR